MISMSFSFTVGRQGGFAHHQQGAQGPPQQRLGGGAEQQLADEAGAMRAQHQQPGVERIGQVADFVEHLAAAQMLAGAELERFADLGGERVQLLTESFFEPAGEVFAGFAEQFPQLRQPAGFDHMQQFEAGLVGLRDLRRAQGGQPGRWREVGGDEQAVQGCHGRNLSLSGGSRFRYDAGAAGLFPNAPETAPADR